jgi:predicted Holliday junction resolvase-like endonuclease
MRNDSVLEDLTKFFKAARHLWGRCPRCDQLFRLSEAAISFGDQPPRDWLQRLKRRQGLLESKEGELQTWHAELDGRESELRTFESDLGRRERDLEGTARALAREMLKDDKTIRGLLKDARQQAVQRSRSTLLGKLFERLAPFLQRFGHDPRDVRPILDPIDYVVFDGLTLNRRVERVTFVEVKAGTSRESPTQRSIADAVNQGRLAMEVWQFGKRGVPLEQQLLRPGGVMRLLPPGG